MQARLDAKQAAPAAMRAMGALSAWVHDCGLELPLQELVKIRASQINGCAFCLQLHAQAARKLGVTEDRIYLLNAWREAPVYTPRERAALAWTEALTLLTEGHVPDAVYEETRQWFSEQDLVNLSLAITVINSWNRLMVAFRTLPVVAADTAQT